METPPLPSTPTASSSAVTIPVPGKSILKARPTAQPTLLSRFSSLSRFLPTDAPTHGESEDEVLKRAHFILPRIATVYPISTQNAPSSREIKEEKVHIEKREFERRRRVTRMSSFSSGISSFRKDDKKDNPDYWTLEKVESFYQECCAGIHERPDPRISAAFHSARSAPPRTVTFSQIPLTDAQAQILSDILCLEWGLRRLSFIDCDLTPFTIKMLLHSLLREDTLNYLSLSSHPYSSITSTGPTSINRKTGGGVVAAMRFVGAYVGLSKSLTFLDLSSIPLSDKKSIEYLVAGLHKFDPSPSPPSTPVPGSLQTLKMDDCSLRGGGLEVLCKTIRTSSLMHLSLRQNRITASGCVALAVMLRDYPDVVEGNSAPTSPTGSTAANPHTLFGNSPATAAPTPTATSAMGTTYTPYVPRARRAAAAAVTSSAPPSAQHAQTLPTATSRAAGITAVRGPSEALLSKVRALDNLPRMGCLRTLDLRGNDLRGGVQYLSQVLKRNRTLKTLNLAENKVDEKGLAMIAEALKYNQSLETLDLARNPCGSPSLEGLVSLRTSLSLSKSLKRLFLTGCGVKEEGAILLGEFLEGWEGLVYLGLTQNELTYPGVLALHGSLKKNYVLRCLDLDVPPGNEAYAKLCRGILECCVRNTELADPSTNKKKKAVWGLIEESELAKGVRLGEEMKGENDILVRARAVTTQLTNILATPPPPAPPAPATPSSTTQSSAPSSGQQTPQRQQSLVELASLGKSILAGLQKAMITQTDDIVEEERMMALLDANERLTDVLARATAGPSKPTLSLAGLGFRFGMGHQQNGAGFTGGGGRPSPLTMSSSSSFSSSDPDEVFDDTDGLRTPRMDKGKRKAVPEPEEHEKVLSPIAGLPPEDLAKGDYFGISGRRPEGEEEEEEERERRLAEARAELAASEGGGNEEVDPDAENVCDSPTTDRSRSWVEEEGEVFRKGNVLLGEAEMEGEWAGEELRKELLEAMVERPPPRPIDELPDQPPASPPPGLSLTNPSTPTSPHLPVSPTIPLESPRPYLPRSRSGSAASSIHSLLGSPVSESPPPLNGHGAPKGSPLVMSAMPSFITEEEEGR